MLQRKERPIPLLFSRLLSRHKFREVTPALLGDDPFFRVARVPSFDTRSNVNDALSRGCRLALQWMGFSLRLRSLRCSLLSQGVNATMNRSDSSCTPLPSAFSLLRAVPKRVVGALRSTRGLPRSRMSLFPSSRRQSRHGVYPVLDFAIVEQARPPVSAESRSLSFRADVWLGPFTDFLTEASCLCLLGVLLLHRSPGGI